MSDTQFHSGGNIFASTTYISTVPLSSTCFLQSTTGIQAQGMTWLSFAAAAGSSATTDGMTITWSALPDITNAEYTLIDDFFGPQGPSSGVVKQSELNGWIYNTGASGNFATSNLSLPGHPGVVSPFDSGGGTPDQFGMYLPNATFRVVDGAITYETVFRCHTNGGGSAEAFGLVDSGTVAPGSIVNGIYFYIPSSANSLFNIACSSASNRTLIPTTKTMGTFTWYKLGFVISAADNSIAFFINSSAVGSISTNVPGSGVSLLPAFLGHVTAAGNQTMDIDYVKVYQQFNAAR